MSLLLWSQYPDRSLWVTVCDQKMWRHLILCQIAGEGSCSLVKLRQRPLGSSTLGNSLGISLWEIHDRHSRWKCLRQLWR
jgi:hypothetical protein